MKVTHDNVTPFPQRIIQGASAAPPFSLIKAQTEAILFSAENAVTLQEIRALIGDVPLEDIRLAILDLSKDYESRAFLVHENGGRYQLRTRPEHSLLLRKLFQSRARSLSKSSLETLAIVAYKQPITRAEVNAIRGVDSSSIMLALKEKELIEPAGTRKDVGSPIEYRTTPAFLETFGLASLRDLPRLRSLQMPRHQEEEIQQALKTLEPDYEEAIPTSEDLAFSAE
jgi:segregation and condensation protein B